MNPIDEKLLTKSQARVMRHIKAYHSRGERLFILWFGGVRSGKSFGATLGLAEHSRHRSGRLYGLCAYTQRQAIAIYVPALEYAASKMGLSDRDFKVNRSASNPRVKFAENEFLIFGGSDVGKYKAIQGLSLSGLLADEIPILDREFLMQAEARVSDEGGVRLYTANKTTPYHWTTKYYLNRIRRKEIKGEFIDSHTSENPHIDAGYIAERESEYDEIHRTRFMDNEFALDAEPIYQFGVTDAKLDDDIVIIWQSDRQTESITASKMARGEYVITDYGLGFPYPPTNTRILINSDRPILSRHFSRKGYKVRNYRGEYLPRIGEITQLAGKMGRVKLWGGLENRDMDILQEAIETHSHAGVYKSNVIRCVETLADWAFRESDRNSRYEIR